jgi:divalent metal cation (Fe/Co/Zn/Cd) transporter
LTALCLKLPSAIRMEKVWMKNHPKVEDLLKNKALHFKLELYLEQFINFAYGIFKIVSGVLVGSAWIGADGIYNLVHAFIQLFQILRRKKPGTLQKQWKSYRFCGVLILLMHLTLIGIVFQMVNWNRVQESGEIMIIATSAFTFYKFISSFIDLAKDRKHTHPIDSSVRMLELSQAIFAVFSLQAGLLHTFGSGESWEHWLNLAVGCTVCLLTVAMGIYMIRRGNREIKKLQEKENGKSFL